MNKCARTTKRYSNEHLKLLSKPCTFLAIVQQQCAYFQKRSISWKKRKSELLKSIRSLNELRSEFDNLKGKEARVIGNHLPGEDLKTQPPQRPEAQFLIFPYFGRQTVQLSHDVRQLPLHAFSTDKIC